MEKYIQNLDLSPAVKFTLKKTGIIKVSDLNRHNYKTLVSICFGASNIKNVMNELNSLGYLLPPENEISVYDVTMSRRLQNALTRNNVLYLSQLSMYSRKRIFQFRNLGEKTMLELDKICKEYGIHIYAHPTMKDTFTDCLFPTIL